MNAYNHSVFQSFPEISLDLPFHLRLPNKGDAAAYLEYMSQKGVARYVPDNSLPTNVVSAEECLQYFRDLYHRKQAVYWAICENQSNKMIGSCGYEHWSALHRRLELAYDLSPEYWQQGIMSDALSKIIAFGFQKMEANRIDAFTTTDNEPSTNLLKKLGFIHEGTLREYRFFKGKFIDVMVFGLKRTDWSA